MKTLYLCGPINGCTDDECKGWRDEVKRRLGDQFRILDPMRRDYRGAEDANAYSIVVGDLGDIQGSDVILAIAERPSWGTAMEIREAFVRGKEVVVVCGQERVSPWLRYHANRLAPTLDEAIGYLGIES